MKKNIVVIKPFGGPLNYIMQVKNIILILIVLIYLIKILQLLIIIVLTTE